MTFYIEYDVVDRLGFEVMRGFGLVPRRGAEVGGILLGTAEQGERLVVRIDDFVPVPSEHLRGPSYILSEKDLALLDEELAKVAPAPDRRIQAVGYYRSHTRDQFRLGAEDFAILDSRFCTPTAVCLLVRPFATRVSEAAVLWRSENGRFPEGDVDSVFPFRRRELGGGKPARRRDAAPEEGFDTGFVEEEGASPGEVPERESIAAIASQLVDQAAPTFGGLAPPPPEDGAAEAPVEKDKDARAGVGWVWIPLSFIFLLLGVFLGFQIAISFREPKPVEAPKEDPYVMGLKVEPSGESLTLRWNVAAAAIQRAERAVLTITEGGNEKTVDLAPEELRRGGVLYRNVTPDVKFRLEAVLDDRSSVVETASTRVVEPAKAP